MTEVSKEAVEALACALKQTSWGDLVSADVVLSEIEKRGYTITSINTSQSKATTSHIKDDTSPSCTEEPSQLPDEVEEAIQNTLRSVDVGAHSYHLPQEWAINCERDMEVIRSYIANLEAQVTTLRTAAEIGLDYVVAAQGGLTFTKPRMASDVEIFNDALKMGGDE